MAYGKFLVVIGNFRAGQSARGSAKLQSRETHVVDLLKTPTGGLTIASFQDVEATRWDKVGFDLSNASDDALQAEGTSDADYAWMKAQGYSLYFEGEMTKPGGQSCRPNDATDCVARELVTFKWGLKAGTSFDDCASATGETGFSVPTGGTVQIKPTIHGDHWFFTNLTQGVEITDRKAQWIADADVDRNGETTIDELKQVSAVELFTTSKGYNLSGALIPISSAYSFLEAQARTLGDYQGDGECPTRAVLP